MNRFTNIISTILETTDNQNNVEAAAKAAGYTEVVYRGDGSNFNKFDVKKQGGNFDEFEGVFPRGFFWFSSSSKIAESFANFSSRGGGSPVVRKFYLKLDKMYTHPAEDYANEGEYTVPNDDYDLSKLGDYDSMKVFADAEYKLVSKAEWDDDGNLVKPAVDRIDQGGFVNFAVVKPTQMKLADPITYDDEGKEIPLSERFNPNSDDIRY